MGFEWASATAGLHDLASRFGERIPYIALALVVFVVFYAVAIGVRRLATSFALRTQRRHNVGIVLGRLGQGAIVLLGLLVALVIAMPGFTPGQLVSVLGLSSVAIGFAFRDILQNFLAGILLLLSEPFRIGDQIRSGDFEGTVENIETRATFILTYDGRRIVMPNSTLFVNPVTVNTAHERRRIEHDLVLTAPVDVAQAKRTILGAVSTVPHVLREPPPDVLVTSFTDKSTTLRVRWWIEPPHQYELQQGLDAVLARVHDALADAARKASAAQSPTGASSQSTHTVAAEHAFATRRNR